MESDCCPIHIPDPASIPKSDPPTPPAGGRFKSIAGVAGDDLTTLDAQAEAAKHEKAKAEEAAKAKAAKAEKDKNREVRHAASTRFRRPLARSQMGRHRLPTPAYRLQQTTLCDV